MIYTTGFAAGLLVSVFSKTLVLLAGIAMAVIQVRSLSNVLSSHTILFQRQLQLYCFLPVLPVRYCLSQQRPRPCPQSIHSSLILIDHHHNKLADTYPFSLHLNQIAARNGIDLVSSLQLKQRLRSSRVLAMLNQHAAFKLSFALAFALSAFMSF